MHDSVPFNPPYVIKVTSQEGDRWMEVRADGSEVACEAPTTWPLAASDTAAVSVATASKSTKSKNTILNVPYAEKDEAKSLGAKWDAARKKWYVPQGVSTEPFGRWIAGE